MSAAWTVLTLTGGASIGSTVTGGLVSAAMQALTRSAAYAANEKNPNVVPPPELLAHMWMRYGGYRDPAAHNWLKHAWKSNGINVDTQLWRYALESLQQVAPFAAIPQLFGPPGAMVADPQHNDDLAVRALHTHGYRVDDYLSLHPYLWIPYTWRDIARLDFIGVPDIATRREMWRWAGFGDAFIGPAKQWADACRWLMRWIPGVSDLIRFMVREAFDQQIVAKYEYDAEYPDAIDPWLRAQGIDYRLPQLPGAQGQPDKHWGHIYWRAHWEVPSPTQVRDMLILLRPHRAQRLLADWQRLYPGLNVHRSGITVTPDDVRTVLKIADYAPYWRDRLMALTYSPMTQRYLQQSRTELVPDPVPLAERVQDLGFLPTDAAVIARMIERRAAAARLNSGIGVSLTRILSLVDAGIATDDDVKAVTQAYDMEPRAAEVVLQAARWRRQIARIRRVLPIIRRAYVRRLIDAAQARRYMQLLGLPAHLIDDREAEWTVERELTPRRRTAAQILADWEWGIVTRGEALADLTGLGYTQRDALRVMRTYAARRLDARAQRIMRQARQIEADAMRRIARAEQRERQARQLARQAQMDLERARKAIEQQLDEARKEAEKERQAAEQQAALDAGGGGTEQSPPQEG